MKKRIKNKKDTNSKKDNTFFKLLIITTFFTLAFLTIFIINLYKENYKHKTELKKQKDHYENIIVEQKHIHQLLITQYEEYKIQQESAKNKNEEVYQNAEEKDSFSQGFIKIITLPIKNSPSKEDNSLEKNEKENKPATSLKQTDFKSVEKVHEVKIFSPNDGYPQLSLFLNQKQSYFHQGQEFIVIENTKMKTLQPGCVRLEIEENIKIKKGDLIATFFPRKKCNEI